MGQLSVAKLKALGCATELLTFPMAHEACPDEIAAAARFLRGQVILLILVMGDW